LRWVFSGPVVTISRMMESQKVPFALSVSISGALRIFG
jgi:hypothetical protein